MIKEIQEPTFEEEMNDESILAINKRVYLIYHNKMNEIIRKLNELSAMWGKMIHPEPSLSFKTTISLDIDGNIRISGDENSIVFNQVGSGEEKDNFIELTWQELAELVLNKD